MKLKTNLTFSMIYHFLKIFFKWNFLFQTTKKPPDWVTSLGDYDEKEKFGISLNKGYSMKIEIRLGRKT